MANIILSQKSINLDLQHQGFVNTIYSQQGDKDSRELKVYLFDDGKKYNISSDMKVYLVGSRADGCVVNREVSNYINNEVAIVFKDEELAVKGNAKYKIQIEDGDQKLSSSSFKIKVYENVYNEDGFIATPQFSELAEELSRMQDIESEIEDAEEIRVEAENARTNNETIRELNEESRVAAENTRDEHETARETNEDTRQTNEETRVDNEETRKSNEESRINAEDGRVGAETDRVTADGIRETNESARIENETTRQSAETTRNENEIARDTAEKARIESEDKRDTAEKTRISAEIDRDDAESKRVIAENTRIASETERNSNEDRRKTAEVSRENAETNRTTAESTRVTSENSRIESETTRNTNETTRQTNEESREKAETTRVSNEDTRIKAETSRSSAESNRATNETARNTAEETRVANELKRKQDEETRVIEFKAIKENATEEIDKIKTVKVEPIKDESSYKVKVTDKDGNVTESENLYNSISIGDVQAGAYDDDPAATITGDFGNQKLNLTLPTGKPFVIKHSYSSVQEMNDDINNMKLYDFAIINTGNVEDEDTGKLFMKDSNGMLYLTDLSGVQGIQGIQGKTGLTPKLTIGNIEVCKKGELPSATITGTTDDPILNLKLPYKENINEYDSKSDFPIEGEAENIYVDTTTNTIYYWNKDKYMAIGSGLTLGEISSTAYPGDKGKVAYDHSQSTHARTDATKVESSSTNGNIKINGTETTVYTHPSGTNPHGTTKSDVGLGNVENKSSETIRSEISSDNVTSALGYTPYNSTNPNGYTSNVGTITGIKMNGSNKGTSGEIDLGTVITEHQDISGKENTSNKVTSISSSSTDTQYPSAKAVYDAIEALPEPMVFKGSLGTGGTIAALPTAGKTNEGYTYKVITDGTYAGKEAKVGDTFISDGSAWVRIPSGDEPSGTVTSVGMTVPTGLTVSGEPITSSGTFAVNMEEGYSIPTNEKQANWDSKYNKPSVGIPKSDLANDIKNSLNKADNVESVYLKSKSEEVIINEGTINITQNTFSWYEDNDKTFFCTNDNPFESVWNPTDWTGITNNLFKVTFDDIDYIVFGHQRDRKFAGGVDEQYLFGNETLLGYSNMFNSDAPFCVVIGRWGKINTDVKSLKIITNDTTPTSHQISITRLNINYDKIPPYYYNLDSYGATVPAHSGSGNNSVVIGMAIDASGEGSVAEGETTIASGYASHAEGYINKAAGLASHVEGQQNEATGQASHVEGALSTATAIASHAEGYGSNALAQAAHAEGQQTTASGLRSHSEGSHTLAEGAVSHAEGYGTIATSVSSHSEGRYNIKDTEKKYAHIVGNGTSDSARSNAHTLDWKGNAWYAGDVQSNGSFIDKDGNKINEIVSGLTNNTMDLKMLGYTIPKECPIQNEVNSNMFVQKVGRVDLGTLDWKYDTTVNPPRFLVTIPNIKDLDSDYVIPNIFCKKYKSVEIHTFDIEKKNEEITGDTRAHLVYIRDTSYSDAITFKQALQGVYLYYELAEEILIPIDGNEVVEKINDNFVQVKDVLDSDLFTTKNGIVGKWLNRDNGELNDGSILFGVTDYIEVVGDSSAEIMNTNDDGLNICYYDNEKKYIIGINQDRGFLKIPSDAKYVRITYVVSNNINTHFYGLVNVAKNVAELNHSSSDYGLDNKFDGILKQGAYGAADGVYWSDSQNYICNRYGIPCNGGDIIKVVCDFYHTDIFCLYYDVNGNYIGFQNNVEKFTAPQDARLFYFDIERTGGITPQTAGHIGVYVNNEIDVVKKSLAKRVVIPYDVKPHTYLTTEGGSLKFSPYSIITVPVESGNHYVFYGLATNPGVRSQLINENGDVKSHYIHYSDSWEVDIPNDDLYFVQLTVFNSEGLPTFEMI